MNAGLSLVVRKFEISAYHPTWQAMKTFTDQRDESVTDELWLVEHFPVFTQGQGGKAEHLLNPGNIPVIHTDRGGQITYHGPGQLVVYTLFNLRRLKMNVRAFVTLLEKSVIGLLAEYNISAQSRCDAPGVYVDGAKICSLGLRVRRGCSYHGLALNINLDLAPFSQINPCGFANLPMTKISNFIAEITFAEIETKICQYIAKNFGYNEILFAGE